MSASPFKSLISSLLVVSMLASPAKTQTNASLSGVVQDLQGRGVGGAKVTLSDSTRNIEFEATTNIHGRFSFPALPPGTYQAAAEAQGYRKSVKVGIIVNIADYASAGVIQLEAGAISNVVEVMADEAQQLIKTESAEQGQVISGQQILGIGLNGRNYLDLLKLTPGVVSSFNGQISGPEGLSSFNINGTRGNQHNLTIDGVTNVNTSSNGMQQVVLSLDNIAEFKILTATYQAEYGRSAGGDIRISTRGGTKDFHGTAYFYHRHEQFNANSFFNNANGLRADGTEVSPRNFYRYNYQGYYIGGPIYLRKKFFGPLSLEKMREKLFFFWLHEWQAQFVPSSARQSRVPTAFELAGDFSRTRDGNGNPITIRDPVTGQPFSGNRIPTSRLNPSGAAILRFLNRFENFPLSASPNGALFNHSSQFNQSYPRSAYNTRIDYNITEQNHMFARYTRSADRQILPYGFGFVGGNNQIPVDDLILRGSPAWNLVFNVTLKLSTTLTNEFIFGASHNNITFDPTDPNAATFSGIGLTFQPPFPYPPSQFVNISFSGTPSQNFAAPTGYSQFPFKYTNTNFDFRDNVLKVWGNHTAKAGIYIQRSRNDQPFGTSMTINFSNNPANPGNTGHPYANTLLGNFDSFVQSSRGIYVGQFRSTNIEWYIQDNWKVNRRLVLDYGTRFSWVQPQYDQREQTSFFDPQSYDRSKAVRLYNRAANGQAFDPARPSILLPAFLIGRIVPGSGDPFNGMRQSALGFAPGGFRNRGLQYDPAFGFAYDVFGNAMTVVRGGFRTGYDRVSGNNVIFPAGEQPPFLITPTFNFGNLNTVGLGAGQPVLGVNSVRGADFEGHIPNVQSFSLQVQQRIGYGAVLGVGYVGTLSRHLSEDLNLNYIPYGTTFTKEAQDPTRYAGGIVPNEEPNLPQVYRDAGLRFTGANALPANLLRRFPGYGTIQMKTFGGSANYHSLQVTAQRRYRLGLTFGAAYTYSKVVGTSSGLEGEFINPICSRCFDYGPLDFDRAHTMVINYLYDLPKIKFSNRFAKGLINGWQLTGVTQLQTGTPIELNFTIPSININQRISGSWTEEPRIIATGDTQPRIDRENAFDFTQVRLPNLNPGPLPRSIIRSPGINVTDLSVFRRIPLGGDGMRYIQLRIEMYNVFNHSQFDQLNTGLIFNIAANFSDYVAKRQGGPETLRNIRGGASSPASGPLGRALGEFNGQPGYVSANRVMQLAARINF